MHHHLPSYAVATAAASPPPYTPHKHLVTVLTGHRAHDAALFVWLRDHLANDRADTQVVLVHVRPPPIALIMHGMSWHVGGDTSEEDKRFSVQVLARVGQPLLDLGVNVRALSLASPERRTLHRLLMREFPTATVVFATTCATAAREMDLAAREKQNVNWWQRIVRSVGGHEGNATARWLARAVRGTAITVRQVCVKPSQAQSKPPEMVEAAAAAAAAAPLSLEAAAVNASMETGTTTTWLQRIRRPTERALRRATLGEENAIRERTLTTVF